MAEQAAADWPICYGFSEAVVPKPARWPASQRPVGFFWPPTDADWAPEPRLADFLASGPPPVYVGFGSMPIPDPDRLAGVVHRATRLAGQRLIVGGGWAGLSVEADDAITVAEAPHDWLFARVAAVVHHCGAGTTAASLRAGVPVVPVPVMIDQPFWSARLQGLGAAYRPIPLRRLTIRSLATALTAVTSDPRYRAAARAGSDVVRRDDATAAVARQLAAG